MPFSGKHIIEVIEGKRCTLVETGIASTRLSFLKELLEFNKYEVKTEKDASGNFKIGVTDVVFNATIDVYKRRLKTKSGHIVTPSYWFQLSNAQTEAEVNYWVQNTNTSACNNTQMQPINSYSIC